MEPVIHDLVFQSAATRAGLIRTRQVSTVEVLTAYLERIAVVNPLLNALVQPAGQAALAEARQLDANNPYRCSHDRT